MHYESADTVFGAELCQDFTTISRYMDPVNAIVPRNFVSTL